MTATEEEWPVVRLGGHTIASGSRFGRWVVIQIPKIMDARAAGAYCAECRCDCGSIKTVYLYNLTRGISTQCLSCSISATQRKHGESAHVLGKASRLYGIWQAMRRRCSETNRPDSARYYGRGIRVCAEWNDFRVFRDWALANGYRDDLTLDRWPDNNGNYEAGNCRWATWKQQNRNRRDNRTVTAFGETKTLADWAEDLRCKVDADCIGRRISKGWSHERAITSEKRSNNISGQLGPPQRL